MFRRRGKSADAAPPAAVESVPVEDAPAAAGPWDVEDVPVDDPEAPLLRLDLGSLRIPAYPDVEVRLETDVADNVMAVSLVAGRSALQVAAFAAPRQEGIWTEVRGELHESLRADQSAGVERDGTFGPELVAAVPGPEGPQTARFVGVDGPRWFLRGVFTGPAATDPEQARVLEQALRDVVVVRGSDPLPVRDPLPLSLPTEVTGGAPTADEAADDEPLSAPGVPPRGPEITEIG